MPSPGTPTRSNWRTSKNLLVRLNQRDSAWFERRLPAAERWRLYADFLDDAAFLDIETTGLSSEYSYTTMVGVLDNSGYHAFVRGDNLDEFLCSLRRYKLVVTFNGASFDLPFLRGEFGKLPDGFAHMDLRWVLARLGYRGGLKKIERSTGLDRQGGLADLDGRHAVVLWEMAQQGEDEALETLIRYNAEDVASLPLLAEMALLELSRYADGRRITGALSRYADGRRIRPAFSAIRLLRPAL